MSTKHRPRLAPSAALAIAAVLSSHAEASTSEGPIRAPGRVPLAFILSSPSGGEVSNTSSSEIIRVVSQLLERHTGFFLQITEAQVVTECQGSMLCLVRRVRPEQEPRSAPPDTARSPGKAAALPPFLLVLSHVAFPGEADRISAVMVDLERALDILEAAPRERRDWERDAEAAITQHALALKPERASVRSPIEAEAFLETLILEKLSPAWKESGHWAPFGALEISTRISDASITLDGSMIGTTRAGVTRIEDVEGGAHELRIEHPGFVSYAQTIDLDRGSVARVEVELVAESTKTSVIYSSALWGGAAVLATGATLVIVAVARSDGAVHSACFRTDADCRASTQFQTFGYQPRAVDDAREVNPRGVLVAPLGYSLAATGLIWSLGTYLFGDRERAPWPELGAGVVAGVLAYGLSAALDGSRPN